jgi:hypothetical protein
VLYKQELDRYLVEECPPAMYGPHAPREVFRAGPFFPASDKEDGSRTLPGLRYQILSLLVVAGNLGLSEARGAVDVVVDEALLERERFYDTDRYAQEFSASMFAYGLLYNRQILGTAALGTCDDPSLAEQVLKTVGKDWTVMRLARYDAAVTPFDSEYMAGTVPPDFSRGALEVRYLDALDDKEFDAIIQANAPVR